MMTAMQPNPAWFALIRLRIRQAQAYRSNIPILAFRILVQLFVIRTVWEALYRGRTSVDGVSAHTLLVYLSISALQSYLFSNVIAWNIQQRVTSGSVAFDLMRPFGFLKQMIAIQIGNSVSMGMIVLCYVPVVLLVGSLSLPSTTNLILYAASVLLATAINTLIWVHVGMLSFWLLQVNGIRALLGIVNSFLAGALVPLWLMPGGLRFVLQLLPFQATMFLPASIYTGQQAGWDVLIPLGQQVIWIGLLSLTAQFVWRRAQHKIVVQGG
jgi:ABC-type uncharacterized transport system permease subunit